MFFTKLCFILMIAAYLCFMIYIGIKRIKYDRALKLINSDTAAEKLNVKKTV